MRQGLDIRLGQRLALTPRLQRALQLLQLSSLDLRYEIQEAIESNPFLEPGEENGEGWMDHAGEERGDAPAPSLADGAGSVDDNGLEPSPPGADEPDVSFETSEEAAYDADGDAEASWTGEDNPAWAAEGRAAPARSGGADQSFDLLDIQHRQPSLHQHLCGQIGAAPLSPRDRAIAEAVIASIDDHGYLGADAAELASVLGEEIAAIEEGEIEAMIHLVQSLDPPGVGARDLRECLLIQLRQMPADRPGLAHARQIVDQHLELLSERKLTRLARLVGAAPAQLGIAIELIRSLEPRPGDHYSAATAAYVAPDVVVRRRAGRWQVELAGDPSRHVHLNRDYQRLLHGNDAGRSAPPARERQARRYLNTAFKEARWFIRTLEQRDETILRVARAIVERQDDFLDRGDCAMRPLTMREIAAEVGVHESTVSRAIAQKYALTPHGIIELRRFFSSQVGAEDGSGHSATAIQAMIREIIEAESPTTPVSDSAIVETLAKRGISVARRTVAKYRDLLGIPSSGKRRSLP